MLVDRPRLRVPQLAIHLDREINATGLLLNPQQHLSPMWGLGRPDARRLRRASSPSELGVAPDDILGWDVMAPRPHPEHARRGRRRAASAPPASTTSARRWAGLEALLAVTGDGRGRRRRTIPLLVLFDHEEIGSHLRPRRPASTLLPAHRRAHRARPAAAAATSCSAALAGVDRAARPTWPTPPTRTTPTATSPATRSRLNGGPVLKVNSNVRYATDAASAGRRSCSPASRPACPCSATPTAATCRAAPPSARSPPAALGIPTVDVGAPQLAMHSARELCGADDPSALRRGHGRLPRAG